MADVEVPEADPEARRVFRARRTVRLAEAGTGGRLRLDSIARYLGDVAEDDVADARFEEPVGWLVRRSSLEVEHLPRLGETVELATWCSGIGPSWAERTTVLSRGEVSAVRTVTLWVAVDPRGGRPVRLGQSFADRYGQSAGGRKVSARLGHPGPPPGLAERRWQLRSSDFDVFGHVNNAVHWAMVADVADRLGRRARRAEIEYHEPILPSDDVLVSSRTVDDRLEVWIHRDGRRLASALAWLGQVAAAG